MIFRKLRADEIDVRIGSTKSDNGTTLLLYKDARCDMNILDETVGALNWKRQHTRDNANCIVSIWNDDIKEWVSKEDTGTESFTEQEKGLASDSFKRACFNWGIGRELYTAGLIWIPATTIPKDKIKFKRFTVTEVTYDKYGNIDTLIIESDNKTVFEKRSKPSKSTGKPTTENMKNDRMPKPKATLKQIQEVQKKYSVEIIDATLKKYNVTEIGLLPFEVLEKMIAHSNEIKTN